MDFTDLIRDFITVNPQKFFPEKFFLLFYPQNRHEISAMK